MLSKLKQYPLRVLLAAAFLILVAILALATIPHFAIGFLLTGGFVWSLVTIIEYLDRDQ
jgi:hypothetical protein